MLYQFFRDVIGKGEALHLRNINSQTGRIKEMWLDPRPYTADSLEKAMHDNSLKEHTNLYFQVSAVASRSKKPAVSNIIWCDVDIYKLPRGQAQLQELLHNVPTPTWTVSSGNGIHLYWTLKEGVEPEVAGRISKMMHWYLGADAGYATNKLMRIPNTYNCKTEEAKLCSIVKHNAVSYNIEDFRIDEVLLKVSHKLMLEIMLSPVDVDRSTYDYTCVNKLLEAGLTVAEVEHLMMNYPFSGKVYDERGNAKNYVKRTIDAAIQKQRMKPMQPFSTPTTTTQWNGVGLSALKAEAKPPFIVEDFLPARGIAVIAAPPKARKSWTVMQLAHSVSTGTPWLDFDVKSKKKVLYVQAELPNWMVAERFMQMYGENYDNDNIVFYHVGAANLLHDGDIDGLVAEVTKHEAELVIIDPIANFWNGDENNSSAVNQLFDQLAKLQNAGAAVVIVHHSRKTMLNERISPQHQRGSNVFFARPSAVMTLSPMVEPNDVTYTWADFSLRAAAPKDPLKLYTTPEGGFTVTPNTKEDSPLVKRLKEQTLNARAKRAKGSVSDSEILRNPAELGISSTDELRHPESRIERQGERRRESMVSPSISSNRNEGSQGENTQVRPSSSSRASSEEAQQPVQKHPRIESSRSSNGNGLVQGARQAESRESHGQPDSHAQRRPQRVLTRPTQEQTTAPRKHPKCPPHLRPNPPQGGRIARLFEEGLLKRTGA